MSGKKVYEIYIDIRDLNKGTILPFQVMCLRGAPVDYVPDLDSYVLKKGWKLVEARSDISFPSYIHFYRFEEI
jgi:hypothetical protein